MTAHEIGFQGQVVCGDCGRKVSAREAAVVDSYTEFFLCSTCRTRRKEKESPRQAD